MASTDAAAVEHSGGEDGADYDSSDGALPRCPHCDFEASSRIALVAHLADCGGDVEGRSGDGCGGSPDRMNRKMFECDVCNMKFSNGANMRRHKMRHTGVKPYECRICQKRFFRKDHLAEHVTIHTKTLPYHCPICARGFQRQIAMRAHFQNEHVGLHDVVKSCPLCSFQVPSLKGLRAHFLHRHGIDLDNPGRSMVVDKNGNATSVGSAISAQGGGGMTASQFEDGDSLACGEAATPPMHFLTPHIEISMADPCPPNAAAQSNGDEEPSPRSDRGGKARSPLPPSQPSDSSKPTSSVAPHKSSDSRENGSVVHMNGGAVSLITVKQEAHPDGSPADPDPDPDDDEDLDLDRLSRAGAATSSAPAAGGPVNLTTGRSGDTLIKVSPLKSLLQDDSSRRKSTCQRPDTSSVPPLSVSRPVGTVSDSSYGTAWRCQRLQCVFCGIAFPDQTLYFLHKGCHADSSPWRCNICGEQCGGVYDFNAHLLSKAHQ